MNKHKGIFQREIIFFKENRFGAMTLMLTFQSALGSIAAMYAITVDSLVGLAISAIVTMFSNAAFIAQAPAKWCVVAFNISVIVNAILILAFLIQ